MRHKLSLAAVITSTWLFSVTGVKHTLAQPNTIITGQEYLAFNQTHQVIFLRQLISGQRNLVSACAPDLTVEEIAAYLSQWLQKNPLNLNRPANLAFTQALTDRCQQQTREETQESPENTPSGEDEDRKQGLTLSDSQLPLISSYYPFPRGEIKNQIAILEGTGQKSPLFDSNAHKAELLGGTITTGLPLASASLNLS